MNEVTTPPKPHGFLSDGKKKSHTRLLVVLCVPALVLVPLILWAAVSYSRGQLQEIPLTITGYLGAANGIILGYAMHNKRQEKSSTS